MLPRSCLACFPLVVGLLIAAALLGDGPPGADEWKYDVIYLKGVPLKKGPTTLRGLIVEQGRDQIKILCPTRNPGKPTVVFPHIVSRRDITRMEQLSVADREVLKGRLEALKRQKKMLEAQIKSLGLKGKGAPHLEVLDLRPAVWPTKAGGKALSYESTHFHLISNARSEVVQLAVTRLEEIYAAYTRALPPRVAKARPTTILLARSTADYLALAGERKLNLFNPAFYDPGTNQVVGCCDLEKRCEELEEVRKHHAKLRHDIADRKAALRKAYKGRVPDELLRPLLAAERRIDKSTRTNKAAFTRIYQRFFRLLYHEAFHAYLGTFVYPNGKGSLPHWLNEGLAQIFETAVVEVGELRVGRAGPERREAAKRALTRGTLPRLTDLLRSTPKHFLVAHAGDQQVSDRYYLASWALAFYLTFDRDLVGTPALDEYVAELAGPRSDPLAAFRRLVGKPLDEFEKDYHAYLKALKDDGTLRE